MTVTLPLPLRLAVTSPVARARGSGRGGARTNPRPARTLLLPDGDQAATPRLQVDLTSVVLEPEVGVQGLASAEAKAKVDVPTSPENPLRVTAQAATDAEGQGGQGECAHLFQTKGLSGRPYAAVLPTLSGWARLRQVLQLRIGHLPLCGQIPGLRPPRQGARTEPAEADGPGLHTNNLGTRSLHTSQASFSISRM